MNKIDYGIFFNLIITLDQRDEINLIDKIKLMNGLVIERLHKEWKVYVSDKSHLWKQFTSLSEAVRFIFEYENIRAEVNYLQDTINNLEAERQKMFTEK